jgi:hypothetical protein
MKKFLKNMIFLIFIFSVNTNLYCVETWKNILLEKQTFNSDINLINSFDNDHLVALQYAQISHIYLNDNKTNNLIDFTDWNVGLKDISFSSAENMVFYGVFYDHNPDNPLLVTYQNLFLIINQDSSFLVNNDKWITHIFPDSKYGFVYSNVDANGNGIAIADKGMHTYLYKNWEETLIYKDIFKSAICGTFFDNTHNLIIARDSQYILFRSSNGYTWDSLGRINLSNSFDAKNIRKLIVQNENDFYMITSDGFYYSNNKGLENTWKYKKITTPGIYDAVVSNNNEMYMCGKDGFLCKVNLSDNSVFYYDMSSYEMFYSMYLTEGNKLFVGGRNFNLYELDLSMDVQGDYLSLDKFSVYPNPTGNFITLSESDTKLYESYEIYDISGRLLQKLIFDSNRIDISALESGSYYLRLLSPSGIATAGFNKMK